MRRFGILFSLLGCVAVTTHAQKPAQAAKSAKPAVAAKPAAEVKVVKPNPWVFTYGKDTVYKSEFERLLSKNRKEKEVPSEKDVREYLELYENFKMKVKEAQLAQLDTMASFTSELAGYRKQLANPYLTDKRVTESLIKESYARMKEDVNASHILINCPENASPKDTLAAWNKLMDVRKRAMKGESFDSLAAKYSEDPSAVKNYGNLGWFTAFHMIYPFETQAYHTAKGQISMPFRTRFGYHILKVNDKRAARGEVKVAHIMLQAGPSATPELWNEVKLTADTIYRKLEAGESFEKLVGQYSQDQASKQNNGVMNWFSSYSNFPEPFKEQAFGLNKGEYSKPFKTEFGYHIIKVIDKKPVPELKDIEENIKNKITRDTRSESSKLVVAQRIKKESKYVEYPANVKAFAATIDSSFLRASWAPDEKTLSDKPVVSINDKVYTVRNFAEYVRMNQELRENESIAMVINSLFKKYTDEKALEYEETVLETKYEDFRNLMQEYHDGILLFDLTDKKVWTRAVTDTTGLQKFYENNKTKYMWKERVDVYTYACLNEKVKKEAMKMAAAGKTPEQIKARMNKKMAGTVIVSESKHEKGESAETDKLWDQKGVVDIPNTPNNYRFYYVAGIAQPESKSLKESRGLVTSDYQTYLEKEWIDSLRSKYPVTVNEDAIRTLFK